MQAHLFASLFVKQNRIVRNRLTGFFCLLSFVGFAQKDTGLVSFHFQATVIPQRHTRFHSPYMGENSLLPDEGWATSLTNTFFFALKPWKHTQLIINPEDAGGRGLSDATGLAGFSNGEIFRVGNPKPTLYLARLILEQTFPLKGTTETYVAEDANLVRGFAPVDYVKMFGGRFCLADYFDGNPYNHDPRSQFLNWSFMSAGAWDYAADTRGYTWGLGSEWKKKNWRAALAFTLMPKEANALEFDMHISKAFASQVELTHFHAIGEKKGQLQFTGFYNKGHMGNYEEAIKLSPYPPDVTRTANYNNHKFGFVLNAAQALSGHWGAFARLSWNDGKNETWAYTEIDRSVNAGLQWSHGDESPNALGMGVVVNGLSAPHRDYLAAGGYGFIIGDGRLNYAPEIIAETYYRFCFFGDRMQLSPDYQFALHPAYNKDRGPVHIFALRSHVEF